MGEMKGKAPLLGKDQSETKANTQGKGPNTILPVAAQTNKEDKEGKRKKGKRKERKKKRKEKKGNKCPFFQP